MLQARVGMYSANQCPASTAVTSSAKVRLRMGKGEGLASRGIQQIYRVTDHC